MRLFLPLDASLVEITLSRHVDIGSRRPQHTSLGQERAAPPAVLRSPSDGVPFDF